MVNESMSLEELTARAYARGLPAGKWAKLVDQLGAPGEPDMNRQGAIAKTLLSYLPEPPAIILKYLSYSISHNLLSARTAVIHLLLHPKLASIPPSTLSSIAQAILLDSTGLNVSNPIPSHLEAPIPDVGPSSPSPTNWTISLLLPLLRSCTNNSSAEVVQLISRILSIVEPYPAPPFDVGLEASQLMGSLPDSVSMPLRQSLSGLMTDLAISEGSAQPISATGPAPIIMTQTSQMVIDREPSGPELSSIRLSDAFSNVVPQTIALLLASYRERLEYDRNPQYANNPSLPSEDLQKLMKLCWALGESEEILEQLVGTILQQVLPDTHGLQAHNVDACRFLMDGLPTMLRWWRDQTDGLLSYPGNLAACLKTAFANQKEALDAQASWLQSTWENTLAALDGDSEDGSFASPEGWSWVTIREGLVRKLADLGLLTAQEATEILPDSQVSEPWMGTGESLMYRLSSTPKSHLDALAMTVVHSPGAMRSLASDVIQTIQACPSSQPPDNVFSNLASSPALLACIAAYCPPATFIDIATSGLIEKGDDAATRAEDPQGSMTRFGEGVVLVETFAAQYKMPLPTLLQEARVAVTWSELSAEEKVMTNGWVKALFGPDGIDDETLLSTTPQDFCRLGCGLFQQAITATAIGQIDLDTLHSGLSYFSQPLLSWSLGGIVTWLCNEAHRLGSLSALHLDVLQNLLLSSAIPDGLLRATGPDIASLLAPHAGLGPVFLSSGFDPEAVKAKLVAVGVVVDTPLIPTNTLTTLRSDLQMLRRLELAPASWPGSIIKMLHSATLYEDPISCLDITISELINPPLDLQYEDPLLAYAPLFLTLPYDGDSRILLEPLIKRYIPSLLDEPRFSLRADQSRSIARVVRIAILILDRVEPERAKQLVMDMVNEVKYQRSRNLAPVVEDRHSPKKRKISGRAPLSDAAGVLVDLLAHVFDDTESESRWEAVRSL